MVIADKDDAQAHWAVGKIRSIAPAALVRFEKVDLAEIRSIADFAERLKKTNLPIDLLINNAGVFASHRRQVNSAGIELHFAVNYLGPAVCPDRHVVSFVQSRHSTARYPGEQHLLQDGFYSA